MTRRCACAVLLLVSLGDAYLAMQKYPQARTASEKYLEMQPNGAYASSVRAHLREATAKH